MPTLENLPLTSPWLKPGLLVEFGDFPENNCAGILGMVIPFLYYKPQFNYAPRFGLTHAGNCGILRSLRGVLSGSSLPT